MRVIRDFFDPFRRYLATALAALLLLLTAHAGAQGIASAQATGQKSTVRYAAPADQPHFESKTPRMPEPPASFNAFDGGWVKFHYPPAVRERVQPLISDADRVRAELRDRLGRPVLDKVRVYIARTPGEMSTLAPEGAPYPRYASGVAYSEIGLILLTINPLYPSSAHDLGEVFRHELAHVALHDAAGAAGLVPRWFNEGFAVHASGESSMARLQTLWTATLAGDLLPLRKLEHGFPAEEAPASVAYAQSADLVRFLLRQQDRERFVALIRRLNSKQDFQAALRDAYGLDLASLEFEWREEVAKRYSFWPVFFSGSVVWLGALSLFVFGWRRRRRRSQQTLERWQREEALEDARRARLREAVSGSRVHIVLSAGREPPELPTMRPPAPSEGDVPKVEHEGHWHTLH